jgi:hypothetical protein
LVNGLVRVALSRKLSTAMTNKCAGYPQGSSRTS